ncbi:MAG: sodium:solute symporter family protein [Bacteroidetes bacterium]|nr:sodium:solute symporter family protein [Bacteroidota bacterium]MBU1116952.1 sodium:solute symporter family protein [Bacteroidota bacterium]MBU1799125.1 sodium:solute symporter family protein [Bacteroidota bacterium]
MFGLGILDLVVIGFYFALVIVIGVRASLKIKNQEDYLLGGRKFGKLIQTFASFGQATSADGPVGVATTTFHNGAAGIWSSLIMVFSTPLYWITSPWQRRMRILTMGDFYEERYGSRKMAATYALVASIGMMGLVSLGYSAMSKTIVAITPKTVAEFTQEEEKEYNVAMELFELEKKDAQLLTNEEAKRLNDLRIQKPRSLFSHVDEEMLIWIVCLVSLLYAVMGGLEAAFYTDLLQGTFIILLSVMLIPFSWLRITEVYGSGNESALEILHQKLPQSFFEIFGSPTIIDFTWYFIIAAALVAGLTVVTQPNQLVTNAAAKDEQSARFGFVTGVFIKRFCTILWGLLGLSAILLYTGKIQNSDLVWGYATRDLLGPVGFGLVGFMIASLMAALMSTATALMLTVSGLLLHNVYRPLFENKSEKHYVWVGRILGTLFLFGSAIVATQFSDIFEILKFIWEFFVIFVAAFWIGLKWRRANRKGAWASILITFGIFYLFPVLISNMSSDIKTSEWMLLKTEPEPVVRTYTAREMDVQERNAEIEKLQLRIASGETSLSIPKMLKVGEEFTKEFVQPSKTIFWSKQPKLNADGVLEARGYFFPELVLLKNLGFELNKYPYAFNETMRLMIRLIFPFIVLIFVSLITKPDNDIVGYKFFLKMRTRVRGFGAEMDKNDLEEAYKNPERTKDILLFPNTNLEIYKWNKQDIGGFLISVLVVFIVIGTLFAVVKLY